MVSNFGQKLCLYHRQHPLKSTSSNQFKGWKQVDIGGIWSLNIKSDIISDTVTAQAKEYIKMLTDCKIIDFVIPYDSKVGTKETGKIEKCKDWTRELRNLWKTKTTITPEVISVAF